jgi:hypothetical protein
MFGKLIIIGQEPSSVILILGILQQKS